MKKTIFFLVLVGLVVICQQTHAQFKDWESKFGFRGSILFPENDFANLGFSGSDNTSFDWFKASLLGEAFFAYELTKVLELLINGGYGKYAGKAYGGKTIVKRYGEYETTIIPIYLRFRVSPFEIKGWNPYFYFGGGVMNFNVDTKPNIVSKNPPQDNGWVAIIPAGIGAEFTLSDRVLLDFGLGGALSSSYDLDAFKARSNSTWDSYVNASLGLTFTGENCEADKDMDGLGKCDEEKFGTDQNNPDTGGDGLNDGEEALNYKTNPLEIDSDLDGLSDYDGLKDGEEVNNLKTDPLKKDTDGGTVEDGIEVRHGTDPLDPTDDIVKMGVPIVLEVITFSTNKFDITPESEKVLMGALKTLQTYADILVEISGHTDNVGSNSSNQKLSQRRADAVKAWLVAKGIAPDRINAVGYGKDKPRAANDTSENKRLNRRIEFKRIK